MRTRFKTEQRRCCLKYGVTSKPYLRRNLSIVKFILAVLFSYAVIGLPLMP